jgi:glycosyltransferase involved in cell wall biosynthesis
MNNLELSVVVPVYNERISLINNVKRVLKDNDEYVFEIIMIVSQAAPLETLNACQELCDFDSRVKYYMQKSPPGLGYALRDGFRLVKGTHVQILFADCESDPAAVQFFIKKALATHADMIVASRWSVGSTLKGYSPLHLFLNRSYNFVFKRLFFTHLNDLTFGYNLLKANLVRSINWEGKGHELATEMILKPLKLGYQVEEIPVSWIRRSEGKSSLKFSNYLRYPFFALYVFLSPVKTSSDI